MENRNSNGTHPCRASDSERAVPHSSPPWANADARKGIGPTRIEREKLRILFKNQRR